MGINTYNESSLHKTLKKLYSLEEGSKTEVNLNGYIYDIVTSKNKVIEIQTGNLAKLLPKIKDTLKKSMPIKVVYPLVIEKYILLKDENGEIISKRKSPKKENLYSLFKQLTGIYSILLEKNFCLEVVMIKAIEERIRTKENVQSANKKRRFKKNWLKTNKILKEISSTKVFSHASDYLNFLPKNIPQNFTVKDVQNAIKNEIGLKEPKEAGVMIWLFTKMNIIESHEKKGKAKMYSVVNKKAALIAKN